MKEKLAQIRRPKQALSIGRRVVNTLLILALGKQWAIDLAGSLDTLFSSELVLALLVLAVAGLLWLNYHLLKKRNIIMH